MLPYTWGGVAAVFATRRCYYVGTGLWAFPCSVSRLPSRAAAAGKGPRAAFPLGRRGGQTDGGGSGGGFPLDVIVPGDVLLYRYERRRLFQILGLFCLAQGTFWTYLAYVTFTTLRVPRKAAEQPEPDPKEEEEEEEEKPKPPKPPPPSPSASPPPSALQGVAEFLGSNKWRYGFTGSCLATGGLIVAAALLFARRSVNQILLHRGGQEVSFTTYYPFGVTSTFRVPLRHVSCSSHRTQVSVLIPVKVKGKSFYFLVDKNGQIGNANLFDLTVGAYRTF